MSDANLFAYLIGVLSVEHHQRAQPPGKVNETARELWHAAAGAPRPSEPNGKNPLPRLDRTGVDQLCTLVSQHVSAAVADLILHQHENSSKTPAPYDVIHTPGHGVPAGQIELYRALLEETTTKLKALHDKPEETPVSTLRSLWLTASGFPTSAELSLELPLPELDASGINRLHELLEIRFSGIPLAHLTGRQRFMGVELEVGKAALIPRKETELLGFSSLGVLRHMAGDRKVLSVIDVCTGAGNLAHALALHEPKARVHASDLSAEAVELARRNSINLDLEKRTTIKQGDFLEPFANGDFSKNVDLLVCNPPYISSGKVPTLPGEIISHEPTLAFDGGPFGVRILQRLINEAPGFVRSGGWLAFEVGLGQGPAIIERLRRNVAYADLSAVEDATGSIRAVLARV